jgi:hypothetical protein
VQVQQPVAGQPAQAPPAGPVSGPVPRSGPLPTTAEGPTTTALEPLASGTPAPTWTVVLTVLGAALLLGGLWQVPGLVLVEPRPTRCPHEEELP